MVPGVEQRWICTGPLGAGGFPSLSKQSSAGCCLLEDADPASVVGFGMTLFGVLQTSIVLLELEIELLPSPEKGVIDRCVKLGFGILLGVGGRSLSTDCLSEILPSWLAFIAAVISAFSSSSKMGLCGNIELGLTDNGDEMDLTFRSLKDVDEFIKSIELVTAFDTVAALSKDGELADSS